MPREKHISIRIKNEYLRKWKESAELVRRIENHKFVDRCSDVAIIFNKDLQTYDLNQILDFLAQYGFTPMMYAIIGIEHGKQESLEQTFLLRLSDESYYNNLDFGPDVAEHEADLGHYFIRTRSYYEVLEGNKRLIVGPKGSGKSAIKQMIYENSLDDCILVTPEHYATDILREILDKPIDIGPKERAFATAWKHTLLIEVLKKVVQSKPGIKTGPYSTIQGFLRDNYEIVELDLFSRFVRYIKRIEGIKVGDYELGFKTSELSKLYSLEAGYSMIPSLKKIMKHPFYILIDELDQGWDNSEYSNNFIIGLFLAANELNSYHEMLNCCSFIRGEIFDLVCKNYSHTDKLRHVTEELSWDENSLADVLCKRIAYSIGMYIHPASGKVMDRIVNTRSIQRELGSGFLDYLLNRTSMRPRELIQFVRLCHRVSVDNKCEQINASSVQIAEGTYSKWKFEHLCSEYNHILPGLRQLLENFRFKKRTFSYEELDLFSIKHILNSYVTGEPAWLVKMEPEHLIQQLYDIEFLGIPAPDSHRYYGFAYAFEMPNIYIRDYCNFQIHPGFWKNLNLAN